MRTIQIVFGLLLGVSFITTPGTTAPVFNYHPQKDAERVIQYNNAWIEIDRTALTNNINYLKGLLAPTTKICAIIKADAYGNSLELIMPTLLEAQLPCLGFASNEEARIARSHGYEGILMRVRTATLAEITEALPYHVEELVGNLQLAEEAGKIAQKAETILPVHIAINANGLSRNGLELATPEGQREALAISKISTLKITGLMTHYPVEDQEDVKRNLALFNEQSAWFIDAADLDRQQLILHTANTFATLEVPEAHLDMVRVGGAIYGDLPSYPMLKRSFAAFKTSVAAINHYPKGSTVGYDRTFELKRDTRLANLPVGYSDGYRRAFSNKAFVLIKGHRVPVVGNISMNTTMVDVTDFPEITLGDEVVLFGKQGHAEITQDELEDIHGALLADIYTQWANSNPRVLKKP